MLAAPVVASPGPSLPPRVNGERTGTLIIRLQECSIFDTFARIQFWGEQTFSDLHTSTSAQEETPSIVPDRSATVEYSLIGSIFALYQYLEDASPLQVLFLRQPKYKPSTEATDLGHAQLQPELIGCASIPDVHVCIADLLKLETAQDDTPKTIALPLRRKLQISSYSHLDANGSKIHVGEALFELLFRVTVTPLAASAQLRNEFRQQGFVIHPSITPKQQMIGQPIKQETPQTQSIPSFCTHSSRPQLPPLCDYDGNQSIINSSIGLQSEVYSNNMEEQQSLLEDLLDLCTDDMTMPTIDSANSCVDPFDMWISRIVANASSPPAKEFPSLVAAGSHQSSVLQKVGLLKLEIDELALLSTILNSIKGKNDFVLQYHPPPLNRKGETSSRLVEFLAHAQFSNHTKMISERVKSNAQNQCKGRKKRDTISLLTRAHSQQMEIEFKDDDSVRQWLDATMEFSLFYRPSKPVNQSKLPRVAMLAGKKKESNSVTNPIRVCIGQASLSLRDVILSDTLTSNVKLDLVLAKDAQLPEDICKMKIMGTKVGSLSVRLGLHPGDKRADNSITRSPTNSAATILQTDDNTMRRNTQNLTSGRQFPSSMTPHPISAFLSSFAGIANDNVGAISSTNAEGLSCCQPGVQLCDQMHPNVSHSDAVAANKEEQNTHCSNSRNEAEVNVLKPVKTPVWLDIRVHCISNLSVDAVVNGQINNIKDVGSRKLSCLQLSISCSDRITHSHSDGNTESKECPLAFEVCSQESPTTTAVGSNKISMTIVRSWQVALEAEREGDKSTTVTLHMWHCSSNDASCDATENTLVGLVKIPFLLESANSRRQNNCGWLPGIVADDWFDVVDPKSHTLIGKVQATIAAGMLRQIRDFPIVCKSIVEVQRWWRKTRSISKEKKTGQILSLPSRKNESKPDSLETESSTPGDDDPAFDTVHAGFIAQRGGSTLGQMRVPASSPDSLFEEWSQRPLPINRDQKNSTRQYEDTIAIAKKPADNQIWKETPESVGSSRVSESDEEATEVIAINYADILSLAEDEAKTVDASTTSERSELDGRAVDEQPRSTRSELNISDHFDILVRLGKISGLREILSTWCSQQGTTDEGTLLSVSGLFLSYSISHENAPMSQQDELRELCIGTVRHSKLVPFETVTQDIELNSESTISVPNHETDTKMILSQTLEFKLWYVPIITPTIAAMINDDNTKDTQSLNGCAVISTAKCPMYHLYSLKGYYRGRVPYQITSSKDKKGRHCVGYITMDISRVGLQNNPLSSSQNGQNNANQVHVMSTLKPISLEASFSHGQDECTRQGSGIDPPEEIKWPSNKAPRSKRKTGHSFDINNRESREPKRYRVTDNAEPFRHNNDDSRDNDTSMPTTKSIYENLQERDISEESETLCPSDASFECDQDSEADDTTYRSLTSVMESLANINSKLQRVSSFEDTNRRTSVCDGPRTSSELGAESDLAKHDLAAKSETHDCTEPKIQMEPPEVVDCSETPAKIKKCYTYTARTCEKGSSPMSLTHHYADAATSPCSCGESLPVSTADEEEVGISETYDEHQHDRIEDKRAPNADQAQNSDSETMKQDANGETVEPELGGSCNNEEASTTRIQILDRSSGEHRKQRLEQSTRRHNRIRSQESRARYMQGYLTSSSRGHLDGGKNKISSLVSTPSYLTGIFKNGPFQPGERKSTLSPLLDSLSPPRNGACTWSGERVYPNKHGANEPSRGHMSTERQDRLERIFRSK